MVNMKLQMEKLQERSTYLLRTIGTSRARIARCKGGFIKMGIEDSVICKSMGAVLFYIPSN